MRVNRHIAHASAITLAGLATAAGALAVPTSPALGSQELFKPAKEFTRSGGTTPPSVQGTRTVRPPKLQLVFPIKQGKKAKPDYGDAGAHYGTARGRMHHGQDVFARAGTPLVAIRKGVVIETGSGGGAGNMVAIFNRSRRETYAYFHMAAPTKLKQGERVKPGQRLGAVGCSGSCWGDHLHFEVRKGRGLWENRSVNPLPLLKRASQRGR